MERIGGASEEVDGEVGWVGNLGEDGEGEEDRE